MFNVIKLVLIMIAVLIGIVIMVRSTLASALERKNIQSVYIKILMNHLQLIVLTASFDFDWPKTVLKLFKATEPVAQVTTQVFSFDCFLDQRSDTGDDNTIRLYYQKMIMYAVCPILMTLGSVIYWKLYSCKKSRTVRSIKERIIATTIILFFLVHPSIVTYMFSNFK